MLSINLVCASKANGKFIHLDGCGINFVFVLFESDDKSTLQVHHICRLLSIIAMEASTPFVCRNSHVSFALHAAIRTTSTSTSTIVCQMGLHCISLHRICNQQILYSENHNEINSDKIYAVNATEDELE